MLDERFDIYDDNLNPLGTATRAETHAKGYWHRTFHCWLLRREGDRRYVWFQQRQECKDTNPGCYDITAAGHLTAGETMQDAVRELEEELGVTAAFEQLIPLGQVHEETSAIVNGSMFIDREVSDIFGLECVIPLVNLQLQTEEVAGVFEADIDDLLALFEGKLSKLTVNGVRLATDANAIADTDTYHRADVGTTVDIIADAQNGNLVKTTQTVWADQFVPRETSYYINVIQELRRCL